MPTKIRTFSIVFALSVSTGCSTLKSPAGSRCLDDVTKLVTSATQERVLVIPMVDSVLDCVVAVLKQGGGNDALAFWLERLRTILALVDPLTRGSIVAYPGERIADSLSPDPFKLSAPAVGPVDCHDLFASPPHLTKLTIFKGDSSNGAK